MRSGDRFCRHCGSKMVAWWDGSYKDSDGSKTMIATCPRHGCCSHEYRSVNRGLWFMVIHGTHECMCGRYASPGSAWD